MQYLNLGRTGLKISRLCLGTMAFGRWIDPEASRLVLETALEMGINFIDTADIYGTGMDTGNPLESGQSETILGQLLKGKRHQIVLATKVFGRTGTGPNDGGLSRYHIMRAVENSLRRLGTDYIDLYQIHRFDPGTPLEETLHALDDLVRQGKVCYIGCSNLAAWQICKALWTSDRRNYASFISVQPQYSLLAREIEAELLPFCQSEGIGVMTYSPLGRGILTGKYCPAGRPPAGTRWAAGERKFKELATPRAFEITEELRPLAAARGISLGQFALAWVLNHPAVTCAVLGASRPEHLTQALPALSVRLTMDELAAIDRI